MAGTNTGASQVRGTPAKLGKYEILERLATGGMAEIFLARIEGIEGFEKHVVVKRILPEYARDSRFVAMFLDEARLAARLHHQNIGQVYDIGQEDESYFFAMEYLHGHDARDVLHVVAERDQRIPLEHALTIAAGAAAGLHYAHEQTGADGKPLDIVHRDVSPSNIFLTYDGGVKLVDFGIAHASTRHSETHTGTLKGKVSYMSPEQCRGEELDRRSDIFSLGVVLYELTTVRRLYRHAPTESDYVVMDRIVKGRVPPPSRLVDGYPAALEKIVLRALARNPEHRYATAQALLTDLEAAAADLRLPLSAGALSRYLVETLGRRPEPWRKPRRNQSVPGASTAEFVGAGAMLPDDQDPFESSGSLGGDTMSTLDEPLAGRSALDEALTVRDTSHDPVLPAIIEDDLQTLDDKKGALVLPLVADASLAAEPLHRSVVDRLRPLPDRPRLDSARLGASIDEALEELPTIATPPGGIHAVRERSLQTGHTRASAERTSWWPVIAAAGLVMIALALLLAVLMKS